MINDNTLNTLQNIGFGADIDSLESYILDYKLASRLTDMERYRYNYDKLVDLLKEIKADSIALQSDGDTKELPDDRFSRLFEQFGNIRKCSVYNVLDTLITSDTREKIAKSQDSVSDILALVNVRGLDVMCTYKDGYLCNVYLISESKRILDITSYVRNALPTRIKELSNYELVELRGKLTIPKDNEAIANISKYVETAVAHCIRCKIHTDKLHIVFNDILSEELQFETQWDKLEFLQSLDIISATYVLVRGVDCDLLPQALADIDKAFYDIDTQDELCYYTYGFEVRLNNYMDNTTGFIAILDDADYRRTFESVVKSVITDTFTLKQLLRVVSTKCNARFYIDTVELCDIYDLEKHNISIGEKVQFMVIDKQAILV